MSTFLALIALFVSGIHSFFPDEIQEIKDSVPYLNPKQYLITKLNTVSTIDTTSSTIQPSTTANPSTTSDSISCTYSQLGGGDTGTLCVSPTTVTSDTEWITVSWSNISYTGKYDWIGLFNASQGLTSYAAPPIKYQYVEAYGKYAPASGSIQFKILNRRTNYIFAYITESNPYREIKGVSSIVTYNEPDLYKPMHVHIATPTDDPKCGSSVACMQIMWIQKATESPSITYGTSSSKLDSEVMITQIDKLTPDTLCGQEYGLPAGTSGYFDTGYMLTGYLLNLQADTTYYYKVGDESFGWTEIYNFTSPPKHGSMTSRGDLKFIIFGDMGNVAIDFSMHHSWDFGNKGEIYSINTSNTIELFTNGTKDVTDAVIHIGDISYAVGFLSEWDDFLHMIEPVSSHIPWMTGIGNHEYSWTGEWKPPTSDVTADAYGNADGGGECGVPYNFYFPYANNNQGEANKANYDPTVVEPWYVFDYGMVRTIVMSTEHDYGINSTQYEFISKALSGTDRTLFPWIFIAGHRPMYANDNWDGDDTTSQYLRESLEGLMEENKVALGFWGHQHSYGRTCPAFNGECAGDGEYGAVHLIVGMAGYSLTSTIKPFNYTIIQNNTVYGFVHLTVHNESVISGKFINANTTEIVDQFDIMNPFTM